MPKLQPEEPTQGPQFGESLELETVDEETDLSSKSDLTQEDLETILPQDDKKMSKSKDKQVNDND